MAPQMARQTVPASVQLSVTQLLPVERDGDGVGRPRRLRLEQLVDRRFARVLPARLVPVDQGVPAFQRGQQRELGQAGVGPRHDRLQQDLEMAQHPIDRRRLEEVPVVHGGRGQGAGVLVQVQLQVHVSRRRRGLQRPRLKARKRDGFHRRAVQREHHLEERVPPEVSLSSHLLHQPLEGNVLVVVGAEGNVLHAGQQVAERGVPREIGPQDQAVDEESDQRLELHPRPVGDGRAHRHVVHSGIAVKQRLEGGQESHEEGGALLPAELPDLLQQGQRPLPPGAVECLHGGPCMVHRELEGLQPLELLTPVSELPFQDFALQPVPLPRGEVRVLDVQRPQRGRLARDMSGVEERLLAREDPHRPGIEHDVVHGQQQRVILLGQPQQGRAQERSARQIEGPRRLLLGQPPRLRLRIRQASQVHLGQRHDHRGRNHLKRPAVFGHEGGAQGFVAVHDRLQGEAQRLRAELAPQEHARRDVVGGAARLELLEEPEPLLGERLRPLTLARQRGQGGHRRPPS